MANIFNFKEFSIQQDRCAMKIGTDGVLLGAWASIEHKPESILDIGAGTGVIALMMAQRSDAELIDAVEIEPNAFEQCVDNFEASPWGDRLFCYHASFDQFAAEIDEKYDLIISNPPFFDEQVKSADNGRNQARSADGLPLEKMLRYIPQLLADNGQLALVVPFKKQRELIELAAKKDLYAQRITRVKGNVDSPVKRVLIQFGKKKVDFHPEELTIEHKRHDYTIAYRDLTKEFYVKM
jgi:tRNA1Val (adenine37-N6)-methyltransferase